MPVISRLSSGRRKDRVSRPASTMNVVNVRNEMTRPGACDNYSRVLRTLGSCDVTRRERERECRASALPRKRHAGRVYTETR